MKIVIPSEQAEDAVERVDTSKPYVVLDPWPFKDARIRLASTVLLEDDGVLRRPTEGWILDSGDAIGATTEGRQVLVEATDIEAVYGGGQ